MSEYTKIQREIAQLQSKAAKVKQAEKTRIVDQIKKQIEEFGITPSDLFKGAKKVAAGKKKMALFPKYADPKSGAVWSGHGKRPMWFVAATAKGVKPEDLLVGKKEIAQKPKAPLKKGVQPVKSAPKKPVVAKPVAAKPASKPAPKKDAKPTTVAPKVPAKPKSAAVKAQPKAVVAKKPAVKKSEAKKPAVKKVPAVKSAPVKATEAQPSAAQSPQATPLN